MRKIASLLVLFFLMISCKEALPIPLGNDFYFESPQPINASELHSFPNKYKGVYVGADSTYLNITDKVILSERNYAFRLHQNQLDSLQQFFSEVNGKYISKDCKEVFDSKKIGDSIEFTSKKTDTIFRFSEEQRAKKIDGFLVLSQRESVYWSVKMLRLNSNSLTVKQLYSDDDLKRLDSITKIHSKKLDSVSYLIAPSRNEFKRFNRIKNLGYDTEFTKVKK